MAGIGFTLQRMLDRGSYTATAQAYSYAGLISSGPWVLSILSILVVGLISQDNHLLSAHLTYYLVTVTYMMCGSLILTGGVQLLFTRFVSDRMYEKRHSVITGNLMGLLMLITLVSGVLGTLLTPVLFFDRDTFFRVLVTACFVVLCNFWIVLVFLSALKSYNRIVMTMGAGYVGIVLLSLLLNRLGGHGLLLAFFTGKCFMLLAFLLDIARHFSTDRLQSFEFLTPAKVHSSLLLTGTIYSLALC
ncbi:exopolysaccharide Pel transporter PelG [Endozoicomonas sp. SCSIO W0465]|uniref:exopolysaccharide Pel transporter PelG n=1 Tax=Endozoicomonas sp. SCSIO W0465 TaxID=2918516 RepID=UPI0020754830|nr:exopolysaccharide Pel transporter PelG [Endozoicomonas sp. SCSIO W0465]USE38960.1 exopolysaccharide Pel transporter PelG [Endozoicomonas sp. SCSIO W0465]